MTINFGNRNQVPSLMCLMNLISQEGGFGVLSWFFGGVYFKINFHIYTNKIFTFLKGATKFCSASTPSQGMECLSELCHQETQS